MNNILRNEHSRNKRYVVVTKMSCENSEGKKKKNWKIFFLFYFAKLKLYKSTYCQEHDFQTHLNVSLYKNILYVNKIYCEV